MHSLIWPPYHFSFYTLIGEIIFKEKIMSITREFIYKEWDANGKMGLTPAWFEGADPTTGQGVAHDMLEHFKSSAGIVEGECEALGAFILLRLENGWAETSRGGQDREEILYQNFNSVLNRIIEDDLPLPRHKRSSALNCGAEGLIIVALKKAFADVSQMVEFHTEDTQERTRLKEQLQTCKVAFRNWVRAGYRKAKTRYRSTCSYEVGIVLFTKIEARVNLLLSNENLIEGERVRISANPQNLAVNVKVYNGEDDRWVSGNTL
jgi:hypothetical protein